VSAVQSQIGKMARLGGIYRLMTTGEQGLALVGRQLCKRHAEFLQFHPAVLVGMRLQTLRGLNSGAHPR
jgi:hypothetical protein